MVFNRKKQKVLDTYPTPMPESMDKKTALPQAVLFFDYSENR